MKDPYFLKVELPKNSKEIASKKTDKTTETKRSILKVTITVETELTWTWCLKRRERKLIQLQWTKSIVAQWSKVTISVNTLLKVMKWRTMMSKMKKMDTTNICIKNSMR